MHKSIPIYQLITCLILLSLIFFSSCSDNDPCNNSPSKETIIYLGSANKAAIPYRPDGKDTLVYISDVGDTAILFGIGAKTYFEREWVRRDADPDCGQGDYNLLETLEYTFEGSKNKPLYSISFKAYLWRRYADSEYGDLGGFVINESIRSGTINKDYDPDVGLASLNNINYYTSKVNIKGIDFTGNEVNKKLAEDTLIIYNKNYGILQINLNNQLWKLDI